MIDFTVWLLPFNRIDLFSLWLLRESSFLCFFSGFTLLKLGIWFMCCPWRQGTYITKTAGEIYFTSSLVKCKCAGDEWCVGLRLQGQHCANVDFETFLFPRFSNKSCNEREIGKKHEETSNDYFLNDPISWNICDSSKWLDDLVMWPREHIIHKGLNSLHQWVSKWGPRTPRWSPAGGIIYFHYSFHK